MRKTARTIVCCLIAFTLVAPCAVSHGLAETTPRSVALSQERLAEITALMQKHVDEKKLAGAVAAVARRGKVAYLESVGKQDIEKNVDMRTVSYDSPHARAIVSIKTRASQTQFTAFPQSPVWDVQNL